MIVHYQQFDSPEELQNIVGQLRRKLAKTQVGLKLDETQRTMTLSHPAKDFTGKGQLVIAVGVIGAMVGIEKVIAA